MFNNRAFERIMDSWDKNIWNFRTVSSDRLIKLTTIADERVVFLVSSVERLVQVDENRTRIALKSGNEFTVKCEFEKLCKWVFNPKEEPQSPQAQAPSPAPVSPAPVSQAPVSQAPAPATQQSPTPSSRWRRFTNWLFGRNKRKSTHHWLLEK